MWISIHNAIFTICACTYFGITDGKKTFVIFFVCCAIMTFQSPFSIWINHVKLNCKWTHKCRGGRHKVKKIKVAATSRQQKLYSGQIGSNPGYLIKLKLVSKPFCIFESPISTRIEPFCIWTF